VGQSFAIDVQVLVDQHDVAEEDVDEILVLRDLLVAQSEAILQLVDALHV